MTRRLARFPFSDRFFFLHLSTIEGIQPLDTSQTFSDEPLLGTLLRVDGATLRVVAVLPTRDPKIFNVCLEEIEE